MIVSGDTHPHIAEIMERPVYKLYGYVYKAGTSLPDSDWVFGEGADFELTENDFFSSGNTISASGGEALPIGKLVSKSAKFALRLSDTFTAADFSEAYLQIGIKAYNADGTSFNVLSDSWLVTSATADADKLTLECIDETFRLNRKYVCGISEYSEDLTLWDALKDAVKQSGLFCSNVPRTTPNSEGVASNSERLLTASLSKAAFNQLTRGDYTCAQICASIALLTWGNVVLNDRFVEVNPLLYYKPNSTSLLKELHQRGHTLNLWSKIELTASPITVTGVKCTVSKDADGKDIEPVTYTSSEYTEGYVVDVSDNLFIACSENIQNDLDGLQWLYESFFACVPFSGSHISYPLLHYGDFATIKYLGGELSTYITDFDWNIFGGTDISTEVESGVDKNTVYTSSLSGGSGSTSVSSAAVDYVVIQSATEQWKYRKWNSGKVECWCDLIVSSKPCSTAVGSWYRTAEISLPSYPIAFTAAPCVNMFFETSSGTGALVWTAGTASDADGLTKAHQIYLIRMSSSAAVSGTLHIYACGEAK